MSVSNGQDIIEQTFNDAFLSRVTDCTAAALYDFTNILDSNTPDDGATTFRGGLGVKKNLNVGGVLKASKIAGMIYNTLEEQATEGGTLTISANSSIQIVRCKGSLGARTLSATPFGDLSTITEPLIILVVGKDDANTVEIRHSDTASGSLLFGDAVLKNGYSIALMWEPLSGRLIEMFRNF